MMIPSDVSHIRGLAFDLDGTLVDSRLNFEAIRVELGFPRGTGLLEHIETMTDQAAIQAAHGVIHRHEIEGAVAATWMPGACRMLHALRQRGFPVAILTRNMRAATQRMIEGLGIPVDLVLTRDDCRPKPDPEGLLRIADQWGLDAVNMAYVGDYIFDLEAARNAGMAACLYSNTRNARFRAQADWVISHFDELTRAFCGDAPIAASPIHPGHGSN